MAPVSKRRKSLPALSLKDGFFVRSMNDFKARVRRRESFRHIRLQKELDLEQKIEVEIKMREGTTKLLAACKHQAQSLEAAKSLLTSNERMTAYMAELQRRKRLSLPARAGNGDLTGRGRVCLSDIRLPLIWRDTDHFKNRGDHRRFAVFCLARIGPDLHDTALLCPVDRSLTDLTFPDVIVFNQVPSDFVCTLEVYSHMLRDDMSIASTRRKIKNTIHSSISRTVGKKLAASLRDELNSAQIGPQFELMASARLSLDDVHDDVRSYDLKIHNPDSKKSETLPLFGHFCCRLAAAPYAHAEEAVSGPVTVPRWSPPPVPTFASLAGFRLCLWRDRAHWLRSDALPLATIPVNRDTVVKCSKSGSDVIVANEVEGREVATVLRLQSTEDRDLWVERLVRHLNDHSRWKVAAEKVMEIYTPGTGKQPFTKPSRQGSLYDETPIIECVDGSDKRSLTPSTSLSSCSSSSSPPSLFRERSLSTSSKSRRSHWPFSRNND